MVLPLFHQVRYTPLAEKPWRRRPIYSHILKWLSLATLFIAILLLVGFHFSGLRRILPSQRLLGVAREPENYDHALPMDFQTVGVVFYGRRSSVEILDCYLKVIHRTKQSSRLSADTFSETSKKTVGSWMRYCSWSGRATGMTWNGLSG